MATNPTRPKKTASSQATTSDINTGGSSSQTIPPKERTKIFLAEFFVSSAVLAIGLIPAILLFFHKIDLSGFKDIVLTLGSVFGGPLGIIINNYFKEGGDT
jgi:hypothetical protein